MSRPLRSDELDLISNLAKTVLSNQKSFAASGTIGDNDADFKQLAMYYNEGGDMGKPIFAMFPLSDDDAKRIYDAGKPSPHGKGSETVLDETYRQAHEITLPSFALTQDLVSLSSVLNILPGKLNMNPDKILVATVHKLNAYATGGFFKPHRDTPRGEDHIGTITFCLPTKFTGGELVIRQDGHSITVDASKDAMEGKILWTFLYADCQHEVLAVKSGVRITISYDVFLRDKVKSAAAADIQDTRAEPLHALLNTIMDRSSKFLPEGGRLAFGLRHSYARDRHANTFVDGLEDRLKGIDAVLVKVMDDLELEWGFTAVYNFLSGERYWGGAESDEEEEEDVPDPAVHPRLLISDDFNLVEGREIDECTPLREAVMDAGAKWDEELIWVTTPSNYEVEIDYIAYGNQAEAATMYSAAAIIVEIPPVEQLPSPAKRAKAE